MLSERQIVWTAEHKHDNWLNYLIFFNFLLYLYILLSLDRMLTHRKIVNTSYNFWLINQVTKQQCSKFKNMLSTCFLIEVMFSPLSFFLNRTVYEVPMLSVLYGRRWQRLATCRDVGSNCLSRSVSDFINVCWLITGIARSNVYFNCAIYGLVFYLRRDWKLPYLNSDKIIIL